VTGDIRKMLVSAVSFATVRSNLIACRCLKVVAG
jgi:hypothetical protein